MTPAVEAISDILRTAGPITTDSLVTAMWPHLTSDQGKASAKRRLDKLIARARKDGVPIQCRPVQGRKHEWFVGE